MELPERLIVEILRAAEGYGATVATRCRAVGLRRSGGRVTGVSLRADAGMPLVGLEDAYGWPRGLALLQSPSGSPALGCVRKPSKPGDTVTSPTQSRRGIRARFRAPTLVLALSLAGALAVAGCGATAASAAPGAATTAPAPVATTGATTAAGAASCGADVAAAIKAHLARADVVEVKVIGGCHQASIATTLAPTDVKSGLDICDAAAAVGYTGGISSITVDAVNAKELAAGLQGASCIGEP